jgi:DNA replication protein DnaC
VTTSEDRPQTTADLLEKIFPTRRAALAAGINPDPEPTAAELAQANREDFTAYHLRNTPHLFAQAVTDHPQVQDWAAHYLRNMIGAPSLMLAGATGTGKTHAAYGALRHMAASGWPPIRWRAIEAVDLYARLRPGGADDPEAEFTRYASAPLLLLDDLGATRLSEFVEETTLRLVNYRYVRGLPMIVTTNVEPDKLHAVIGRRTSSRLKQMCQLVDFGKLDRRQPPKAA